MMYLKIQRLWNLVWKFLKYRKELPTFDFRAVKGHFLGNHRFHQPPSHFSSGIGRNDYRRVHRQKYQLLFKEALARLCEGKHLVFTKILCTWYEFRLIPRQLLFQCSFHVKLKTLTERRICFASRLSIKIADFERC